MSQSVNGNFTIYLDNSRANESRQAAYLFENPVDLLIVRKCSEIYPAFDRLRKYLSDGYHIAGWISYETGLFLEQRLEKRGKDTYEIPLLNFGIYKNRQTINSYDNERHWASHYDQDAYSVSNFRMNISRDDYDAAIKKIHSYLTAGDIYQVNFTLKSLFDFEGKPESYFASLRNAQRVEYGAFLKSDAMSVLSLSPELFFQKTGAKVITRPMKGTCRRGRTTREDAQNKIIMKHDEKSRAENLMIVDLLRNDLAKIALPGSVKLKSLYDIEKYHTLFQMTSTIEAEVSDSVDIVDLIKSLFPCGSVTGAPKIRAMEIISELEQDPRGIYTGAIGYMSPDGNCCFNVPIRTIMIDHQGRGQMGIGGAIVADSQVSAEYDECLLKAQFATREFKNFELIESLLWSEEAGYYLLDQHMDRLEDSAGYFDFNCDRPVILRALENHAVWLDPDKSWKIRLLLSRTGEFVITSLPIEQSLVKSAKIITLSKITLDSKNPMLFHKTTDRNIYDRELRNHKRQYGSYDVIFVNEKQEVTEGSFNNIFLQRGDALYTPSLESGVLKGILRQSLIGNPTVKVIEKRLTVADLSKAEKIFMGNSVRGLVEVTFKETLPQK